MKKKFSRLAILGVAVLLSACAGGRSLKPGVATLPEIIAAMGKPEMRWKDTDGQEQLAFTHGPRGIQTYMVYVGADGRLQRIEAVLDNAHFARIEIGKSNKEDVLRLLGPSYPVWTTYYKGFDQVLWEWNFCNHMNEVARFDVYFDAPTGIVRKTEQYTVVPGEGGPSSVDCSQPIAAF